MRTGSQAGAPATRRSVMLFRRARTFLVLIGVFWLWLLFGSAAFIASLFDTPMYALLALYGLGVLTLISLLAAPVCAAFLVMNRAGSTHRVHHLSELAPVIRMVPRRVADGGTALSQRAAAKWRDLAS